MVPKAVLSIVQGLTTRTPGLRRAVRRFVGIAAVLVSPIAAQATERTEAPTTKASVHRSAPSQGHTKGEKRAKRGSRHIDSHEDASIVAAKKPAKAPSRSDADEVTAERASAKNPPKPSSTPLPTLAAATTKPLVEPISTRAEAPVEIKAHAAEPRRTPIIRVSTHVHEKAPHVKPPCLHTPVDVMRGTEEQTFPLTKCDGSVAPLAVEEMSILVRPGSSAKPSAPIADVAAKAKGDQLAPGIKKIDERLVERIQTVIDHFAKPASTPKMFVVSGYRPTSKGSFHAMGRAIDFRLEGVENTDLVAFCKTLPDTGCGFYPNSSFIHLDVRDSGTGHVAWIDASGPGEKPEYVAEWPPVPAKGDNEDDAVKLLAKLDELQLLPPSTHDGEGEDAKPEKQAPKAPIEEPAVSVTRRLEDK